MLGDDPALGLGRSVFGIVDRGLVTHALDRIREGATAHVATVLRDGQLLQVRLAPVHGADRALAGFVLVLEDETGRVANSARRDALLRELSEGTRASLGSIRAAVENVLDYPDMEPAERGTFLEIVRDEAERLGDRVERWVAESIPHLGERWLLTDMRGTDLLTVLARELEREATVATAVDRGGGGDSGSRWTATRSRGPPSTWPPACATSAASALLTLSLGTADRPPRTARRPLDGTGPRCRHLQRLARRAADEQRRGERPGRRRAARRRGLVRGRCRTDRRTCGCCCHSPRRRRQRRSRVGPGAGAGSEFYDFDLFDLPDESLGWQDRRLGDLTYTVFDTETTGLDPAAGDEIVSIGAVRVRQRAAAAARDVRAAGRPAPLGAGPLGRRARHHAPTMLRGQPTIDEVLPLFARFAEDTVLVGHNVGFDMQLPAAEGGPHGDASSRQPVLDTLLLDAALHPDHEEHSLEAIADRLGVERGRPAHRARRRPAHRRGLRPADDPARAAGNRHPGRGARREPRDPVGTPGRSAYGR